MADAPQFGLYVRSVPGHVVQRYGTAEFIGATRRPLTKTQKIDGESPFEWNDRIVPLTVAFCRRYARELDEHLREKQLTKATREEWEAEVAAAAKALESTPAADEPTEASTVDESTKAPRAGKRSK
jgi:hypothetical protein